MTIRTLLVWAALVAPTLSGAQIETFRQLDYEVTTLRAAGKTSQALEAAQRLVEFTERSYPPTHSILALSLERLALAYQDAGRIDDAETLLRRAFAIRRRDQKSNPNAVAFDLTGLAGLEAQQGRERQAERSYEEALTLLKSSQDGSKSTLTRINYELGVLYAWGSRPERAESFLRAAYDGLVADGMRISAESALIFRSIAKAKQAQGDYQEAAELYELAADLAVRSKGESATLTANIWHDMATNWVKAGTPAKGVDIQKRALAVLDGSPGITQQNLAAVLSTMAQIQVATGDLEGAYVNASRALDMRIQLLGESDRATEGSAVLLAEIETKRGHSFEAAKFTMKAKTIREAAQARERRIPVQQASVAEGLRPVYPPEARRFGLEGKTVVRAMISADGTAAFVRLAGSSGYRSLDDAAIKAALGGRFNPAKNADGQAVGGELLIPINWVLTPADRVVEPSLTYGGRVAATIRRQLVYEDADVIQGNPAAVVMVQMKGDGSVTGRALQESSGVPAWDAAVLAAIDKAGKLQVDADGFAPSQLILHVRPKR
jgi:TonB family protein